MKTIPFSAIFLQLICIVCSQDQEEDKDKVRFYFYPNPLNASERHEFNVEDPSTLTSSNFSRNKPVKLLIHGAGAYCTTKSFPLIVIEAYLQEKSTTNVDYNVICVDWGPLATASLSGTLQEQKTRNTLFTGGRAAKLLVALKENELISNYSDVHIIGHSLGGHTSGIVGQNIQESTNYTEKIGRISALDPAGLLYRDQELNLDLQVDLSDADFVDITHTNDRRIGLEGKYGHADIYPDGGENQWDCLRRGLTTALTEFVGGCSHLIVAEYWVTSILFKNITACKADSYDAFKRNREHCANAGDNLISWGDYIPTTARGRYYFDI